MWRWVLESSRVPAPKKPSTPTVACSPEGPVCQPHACSILRLRGQAMKTHAIAYMKLCFAQLLGPLSKQRKHYFSFSFLSFSSALFPLPLSTIWSHAFWKLIWQSLPEEKNYKNMKNASLESHPITQKRLTPGESMWKRYIAKYLFIRQHFKVNFPNSTYFSPLGKHLCFVSAGVAL